MRMRHFRLLLFAVASPADAASSDSGDKKGAIDYNGVKDRYDCIHLGGRWHPLAHHCTEV